MIKLPLIAIRKANEILPPSSFAYHEMRLIAAKILWHFDIQLCPESNNWLTDLKVYGVWDKEALMVTMKRRQ
jgi:cytochrome P450